MSELIEALIRIGVIRRRHDGSIRWPVSVLPWEMWKLHARNHGWRRDHCPMIGGWFCVFRNRPGVIRWEPGRMLPRRWGVRIIGLEIGDRG